MKLLERLRWLATDSALARAPRTSRRRAACCWCWSARRRARAAPGRGSCGRSSAGSGPRPAGWCRRSGCARSREPALSATTVTDVSRPATSRVIGDVERRAGAQRQRARVVLEPLRACARSSYGPIRRYGKRKRPSASVVASTVTLVAVWRAVTSAPGTVRALRIEHPAADRGLVDGFLGGGQAGRGETRHDEPDEPLRRRHEVRPSTGRPGGSRLATSAGLRP